MARQPAVYILASDRYGTLYIGVTATLVKRTWEHRNGFTKGFSSRYDVKQLVYFELHDTITDFKINLIFFVFCFDCHGDAFEEVLSGILQFFL